MNKLEKNILNKRWIISPLGQRLPLLNLLDLERRILDII